MGFIHGALLWGVGAVSVPTKPTRAWVLSQNGLCADWPQRQSR